MNTSNQKEGCDKAVREEFAGVSASCPNDQASAVEAQFQSAALEAHRLKSRRKLDPDFDGQSCVECGEDIEMGRLIALNGANGKVHEDKSLWSTDKCIHCQEKADRQNRQFGMRPQ